MIAELKKALGSVQDGYADARVEESFSTSVVFERDEARGVGRESRLGGRASALLKGRSGFASFKRLSELPGAVASAGRLAGLSPLEGRPKKFAPVPPARAAVLVEPGRDPRKVPLERKVALVRRYAGLILQANPKIQNVRARYGDLLTRAHFASTEGAEIIEERAYAGMVVEITAADGASIETATMFYGGQRGFDAVLDKEAELEAAAKRAVDLLKAPRAEGGRYTAVLDPDLAGVFVHEAFGHLSEADLLAEQEQLREKFKLGTRIGAPGLNITDDPSLPGRDGSYAFDDEGVPGRASPLVRDGMVAGHLHSRATAASMGERPTGNARALNPACPPIVRMSNTMIAPADRRLESLLDGIGRGIYLKGTQGGYTELELFNFSAQAGYLIEDGRITDKLFRGVMLSGNVFETLLNIEGIADDTAWTGCGALSGCGKGGQYPLPVGMGSPHIRIRNLLIGGRQ